MTERKRKGKIRKILKRKIKREGGRRRKRDRVGRE